MFVIGLEEVSILNFQFWGLLSGETIPVAIHDVYIGGLSDRR